MKEKTLGPMPVDFNLDHQFDLFLGRMALDKRRMPAIQLKQLRQAFMGGVSQTLVLNRDEVASYVEDDAVKILEHLWQQCGKYWNEQTRSAN